MENYYVIEFLARERQQEIDKKALSEYQYNNIQVLGKKKSFKSWIRSKLTNRKAECCSCC